MTEGKSGHHEGTRPGNVERAAQETSWGKWKSIYDQRKGIFEHKQLIPTPGMDTHHPTFTEIGMGGYVVDAILHEGLSDSVALSKFLTEKLRQHTLTDVASGKHGIENAMRLNGYTSDTFNHMIKEACDIGIEKIQLVDPFVDIEALKQKHLHDASISKDKKDEMNKRIQPIRSDALQFLSAAQTESQNITISSLDRLVIPNLAYHARVAQEVFRVVPEDGIFICTLSDEIEAEARKLFPYALELPMQMVVFSKAPLPSHEELGMEKPRGKF